MAKDKIVTVEKYCFIGDPIDFRITEDGDVFVGADHIGRIRKGTRTYEPLAGGRLGRSGIVRFRKQVPSWKYRRVGEWREFDAETRKEGLHNLYRDWQQNSLD